MLEISYAVNDELLEEIEITGTVPELLKIEEALNSLAQGEREEISFEARTDYKPRYNTGWLKELCIRSGKGDSGDIIILGDPEEQLIIEGSKEKLKEMAGYFYFESADRYPVHHHCTYREDHPCLSINSIPLVISVKGTEAEISALEIGEEA